MVTPKDPSAVCLEDETLAAFVDGRLEGERRRAAVEHAANCQRCYDLLAETLHAVTPAIAAAAPTARRPRPGIAWLATAASVSAVAVGLFAWRALAPTAPPGLADLVQPLAPDARVAGTPWTGGINRGPTVAGGGGDAGSFRFGVRLVDLRASLEGGSDADVRQQLVLAANQLREVTFMQEQERRLREAATGLDAAGRARLREALVQMEPAWQERFDPTFLAFGEWTEAGRLAALHGRSGFFADRRIARFPATMRSAGDRLSPAATRALGDVSEAWPGGPSPELARRFEKLLVLFD